MKLHSRNRILLLIFIVFGSNIYAQYKYKVEYDIEYLTTHQGGYNLRVYLVSGGQSTGNQILSYNVSGCIAAIETDGMVAFDNVVTSSTLYNRVSRVITCQNFGPCTAGCPQAGTLWYDLGCFTDIQTLRGMFPTAVVPRFNAYRIRTFAEENNYSAATSNLLECESKTLRITDATTCDNVSGLGRMRYGVQYQIGSSTTWNTLLPYTSRIHPFTISKSDFSGLQNGQNLRLRIQYSNVSGPNQFSDILTYTYTQCSPQVSSVVPEPTNCSYTEDGGFTVNFDRSLNSGETLLMTLKIGSPTGVIDGTVPSASFGGTSYTWPFDQSPGTYYLQYQSNPSGNLITEGPIVITSPTAISFSASWTDVDCFGENTGSIQINASGGVGSYQYRLNNGSWTNFSGANSHAITNLSAGNYQLRVRDGNQCTEQL